MKNIKAIQSKMKDNGYDVYIIPTSDFHNSEYISEHFKSRQFLTGFTGSAGTLVLTKTDAYLWVDGRYFIQAEKEIEGKEITLMKIGQPNTPAIYDFIANYISDGGHIAFDGKIFDYNFIFEIEKRIPPTVYIDSEVDLISSIWDDRPKLPFSLLYEISTYYSGKTYKKKIEQIRAEMAKSNADVHILTSLEDQAWLYNLRANDVLHTPVFLAFTIITPTQNILFVDNKKIDKSVEIYLKENDITIKPYFSMFSYVKDIKNKMIMIDTDKISYQIYKSLANQNTIINKQDPSTLLKIIKNNSEIKSIKNVHIKDGVAFTKFMKYVKTGFDNKIEMTESSLANILNDYRKSSKGFIDISFETICAFNDHAAMMHYTAIPGKDANINKAGLLLIDSGGHYLGGTTDITRTLALGKITDAMKTHFTTVLKSVISLSQAVFLKGCTGQTLDVLARGPIWKLLIDYKCGTGHGVGNLLSVHEGPNGFRWQTKPNGYGTAVFEAGMITTNEPGIYIEGKYGIRLENELLCVEKGGSEYGDFLEFETITYAPIDLDAIKTSLLTKEEKDWLNTYHQMVYDTLSPELSTDEAEWLKHYTRKI